MCQYKMLYHSNKGYVSKCPDCRQIQVAYGTSALNFNQEQYENFYDRLLEKQKQSGATPHKNSKSIILSTEFSGFSLIYSLAEVTELITMLSRANFENEVQTLIESIKK